METKAILECINLAQMQLDQLGATGTTLTMEATLEIANIEAELERLQKQAEFLSAENKLLKQAEDDRETEATRKSDYPI